MPGAGCLSIQFQGRRDTVTGVLGDAAAVVTDQLAQDLVVAGDDVGHYPGVPLPEAGRAFNVREEEDEHVDTPFLPPQLSTTIGKCCLYVERMMAKLWDDEPRKRMQVPAM